MTQLHLFSYLKANFQAFGGWIAKTATFGKLAALTPLAVAGWFIAQELKSEVVTIEPIEVPKRSPTAAILPEWLATACATR
jgi:hypothetical protein